MRTGAAITNFIPNARERISVVLLALFAIACWWFASRQNIWIDEATQLSGITLSPFELMRWLAGEDTQRFGVPGDRMPPLGYLIDWGWWHGISQSVLSLRLFHAGLVIGGLAIFAWAERRYLGARWFGLGLVFLAVSPKTIQLAVELRAYPMLFACACVQTALFLRLVASRHPSRGALGLFAILCTATCFIHFFGVVATCAFFGALLLRFVRIAPMRVIAFGLAALIPAVALKPFISGATAVSGTGAAPTTSLAQYPLQLIGGSAYLVWPLAGALFLGGCAILVVLAVIAAWQRLRDRQSKPADYLLVVALLGIAATIAPHFWIKSFDTLKPTYSIWLSPVLALVIASGARQTQGRKVWMVRARQIVSTALVAGAVLPTAIFIAKAEWFAHGPARALAIGDSAATEDVAIVYEGLDTYAYGYFPIVYLTHGRAPQFLAGEGGVRRLPDGVDGPALPWAALSRYREVRLVDIRLRRFADLGACLRGRCVDFDASIPGDLPAKGWRVASSTRAFGYYDTLVTRLLPRQR